MFAVLAGPKLIDRELPPHARARRRAAEREIARRRAAPDLHEREDILSLLLAYDRHGRPPAARRAADAAGRRPRDDRDRARVGAGAARPPPGRVGAAARRRRGLPRRRVQGDAAPAARSCPPCSGCSRRRSRSRAARCPRASRRAEHPADAHARGRLSDRSRSGPSASSSSPPATYTWIPFGGGVRRCIGASFALFEMKAVLRAIAGRRRGARARPAARRAAGAPRGDPRAGPRRPRHRGATSSACAPRATGPDGSLSTGGRAPHRPRRSASRRRGNPLAAAARARSARSARC